MRANHERSSVLLDRLLDGVIDNATYHTKEAESGTALAALELRRAEADRDSLRPSVEAQALARLAQGTWIDFTRGDLEANRRTLAGVLVTQPWTMVA